VLLYGIAILLVALAVWYLASYVLRETNADGDLAGMLGLEGTALETFSESGRVFVRGEEWKASAAHGIIESGAAVKVVGYRHGMVLLVEALRQE
jgi:membrane-bound ClpP family serine protease